MLHIWGSTGVTPQWNCHWERTQWNTRTFLCFPSKLDPHVTSLHFLQQKCGSKPFSGQGQGSQEVWNFINYYKNKLRGWDSLPLSASVKIPLPWWRKSSSLTTKIFPQQHVRQEERIECRHYQHFKQMASFPLKGDAVNHISFHGSSRFCRVVLFPFKCFFSPRKDLGNRLSIDSCLAIC